MEHKGNMYEDTITWNFLAGKCPHNCSYCSTNALMRYPGVAKKYTGELRYCHIKLKKPQPGQTVFVVGQNDLFADVVPSELIREVLTVCRSFDYEFLFQSKNPARMKDFASLFPEKTILCTTIESNIRQLPYMGNTPHPIDRAKAMEEHRLAGFRTQITIEPIMSFFLEDLVELIKMAGPEQCNIGADSKNNHLPEPTKAEVLDLVSELEKFTKVRFKSNLSRIVK